jgi:hypothetical protein
VLSTRWRLTLAESAVLRIEQLSGRLPRRRLVANVIARDEVAEEAKRSPKVLACRQTRTERSSIRQLMQT